MRANRSESVASLIVAAAALLATCVFGFLTFVPGVDPEVSGFLELGFFSGGVVAMGAFIAYFVLSRRNRSGEPASRFDRLLEQRAAALGAMPVGLVAVLIGALWYVSRTIGEGTSIDAPPGIPTETFQTLDTAGIGAFLGFGSLFVGVATWLAIRAERAALRVAREDSEVKLS